MNSSAKLHWTYTYSLKTPAWSQAAFDARVKQAMRTYCSRMHASCTPCMPTSCICCQGTLEGLPEGALLCMLRSCKMKLTLNCTMRSIGCTLRGNAHAQPSVPAAAARGPHDSMGGASAALVPPGARRPHGGSHPGGFGGPQLLRRGPHGGDAAPHPNERQPRRGDEPPRDCLQQHDGVAGECACSFWAGRQHHGELRPCFLTNSQLLSSRLGIQGEISFCLAQ